MVKISILLPVYKINICWLKLCINSVINQKFKNWELCIVDDNSNDIKIKNLIINFAKTEKRIKFFFRNKNGGIANASNDCFRLATGEFITRLDHDDKLAINA
jgi:glycosyltransferase involved in cell wall biosynthesis